MKILSHIDHWLLRKAPPHVMAVARIVWGCWGLIYVGRYLFRTTLLFSSEGVAIPLYHGLAPSWMEFIIEPQTPVVAFAIFAVLILSLIIFTLGYWSRFFALVSLLLSLYFWQISLHPFIATFHRLYLLVFLVFTLSAADRTFSLRMRLTKGSWTAWEPISILPQRIIALQMTFTYLGTGLQKLVLPGWVDGSVLRYSFMSAWATPLAHSIVNLPLPLFVYDAAVFLIKLFEFTLPAGLWIKKTQRWYFLLGALFHIAVALLLSIWSFIVLIPLYIVFIEPEKVHKRFEK